MPLWFVSNFCEHLRLVLLAALLTLGLELGARRLLLLGIEDAVVVRVEALEPLRLALRAVRFPIRLGRRLLLGIEHAVVVGVVLLEQLRLARAATAVVASEPLVFALVGVGDGEPHRRGRDHEGCDRLLHGMAS